MQANIGVFDIYLLNKLYEHASLLLLCWNPFKTNHTITRSVPRAFLSRKIYLKFGKMPRFVTVDHALTLIDYLTLTLLDPRGKFLSGYLYIRSVKHYSTSGNFQFFISIPLNWQQTAPKQSNVGKSI